MRTMFRWAVLVPCLFLGSGCSSFLACRYMPQTIGIAAAPEIVNGLEVLIVSTDDHIILGQPLTFKATIRNISDHAFWVPKDPHLVFVWTYPNGQRDNFIQDFPKDKYFRHESAILLRPGRKLSSQFTIRTHYFPGAGITEFRAIYYAEKNTNSELHPFWNGRALSNAYGVLVNKPRFGSSRPLGTQRASFITGDVKANG